ncbi:MAG: glycosyltransferase, partial [Candidatus Muiribacteriaceae bacterium]
MKKKIAVVLPDLGGGGAEKIAFLVAKGLSEKCDVTLVLFRKTGEYVRYLTPDIRVQVLNTDHRSFRGIIRTMIRLRRLLKGYSDVLCGFQLYTEFIVSVSVAGYNCRVIPVVQISISDLMDRLGFRGRLLRPFGHLYRFFDKIICCSRGVRMDLNKRYNIHMEKLHVINNCLYYFEGSGSDSP